MCQSACNISANITLQHCDLNTVCKHCGLMTGQNLAGEFIRSSESSYGRPCTLDRFLFGRKQVNIDKRNPNQ